MSHRIRGVCNSLFCNRDPQLQRDWLPGTVDNVWTFLAAGDLM